jgi:hypothetical protein
LSLLIVFHIPDRVELEDHEPRLLVRTGRRDQDTELLSRNRVLGELQEAAITLTTSEPISVRNPDLRDVAELAGGSGPSCQSMSDPASCADAVPGAATTVRHARNTATDTTR